MRNPARLAADLSGRPLLLREASVPALARMLGIEGGERPAGMMGFLAQARAAITGRGDAEEPRTAPGCYAPRWLGEADATGFGWTLKDGVACIEIDSCLMAEGFGWGDTWYHGYDTLLTAYEEMASDARVKAVFEVVSSPGGVVDPGLPELAAFKREIRAAAGGKPVWTFARDAYSAAYWIASQSDRIIAPREGGVGSIGAVVAHCDISGLLAKEGIQITAFKFGKRKTDGSPFEPLSDTASETLQAEIDQCGRWFVADVLAGRAALTEEGVLATEAGCYFGQADDPARSGLALNLVDEIQTERLAFAALRELAAKSPTPAAPAASAATKDTDMKRSAVLAAASKAGLNKDQIRKLSAELPEDEAPADDDAPAEEEAEDDDKETPAAEGEESPADDGDEDAPADEAKAIAASAEAKAHPALAMAAISSGQTLAQFKATAAAAPAAGGGRLASTLSGSPRLGADGSGGQKARLSARDTVARNHPAARAKA